MEMLFFRDNCQRTSGSAKWQTPRNFFHKVRTVLLGSQHGKTSENIINKAADNTPVRSKRHETLFLLLKTRYCGNGKGGAGRLQAMPELD